MEKTLNPREKLPSLPPFYVEREGIMSILESAGRKNIYVCADAGCGKTLALLSYALKKEKVYWSSVTKYDSTEKIKDILGERFLAETEDKQDITNALNKHLKGYTLIIDDMDNFFDEELFMSFAEAENVQLIVSSRVFLPAVYDTFIKKDGVFIDNTAFRLTDKEAASITGTDDDALIREIGGYAAAAGFMAVSKSYAAGRDMALSYIFKNVYEKLESDKKRLVSDTVLIDDIPFGLCEYLYGAEYGIRIAEDLRGSFFATFSDNSFALHPMLKAAAAERVGLPKKLVNERLLSYYDETEDSISFIKYCILLGKREEAALCLDKSGFKLLDDGELDFLDKTLSFIAPLDEKGYGVYAVDGALSVLRGDYSRGYSLVLKAFEYFRSHPYDTRFIYSAVFTSRALRNTSYLKEALSVINEAEKARGEHPLLYGYFIDAEKISVLNDMGEFNEAYNICLRGMEKSSVKGDLRVKKLYERLSVCVYYFSKRLARAVYAYEKSKENEKEDYWIKKRSEIYMYGLSALHIIGDRKKASQEFEKCKRELVESGITGEIWYGELQYLKIALYEEVFGERTSIQGIKECIGFVGAYMEPLKNHALYNTYFGIIKELYDASLSKETSERFMSLTSDINALDFASGVECLCIYIKILVDRNDVDKIMPVVDLIIEESGGMLNVFFVNLVMDIALYCIKKGERLKAEQYISWVSDNAPEASGLSDIDRSKLKVLILLSEREDTIKNLEQVFIKCALENKMAYAEVFGKFKVWSGLDKEVKWRTTKARDIMAYLVYMDGEGVSKNRIIENVWEEAPTKALTPIFNTTMYNLRKAVSESEAITFSDNAYSIDKTAVGTDYEYFRMAEDEFIKNKNADNALKVLSWIKGDAFGGAEGAFIAPLSRKCQNLSKEALDVLDKEGYGAIIKAVGKR